jgi:hypothetical protein
MSENQNQSRHSDTPIISGRLRDDAWGSGSSAHSPPQLTFFCDIEAVHFISAAARSMASGDRADCCISSNVKALIEEILAFMEFGRTTEVLET